jgi:molecular chaperone Hsp33
MQRRPHNGAVFFEGRIMKEPNDYLVRASALDGRVRALAIDATGVVGELHTRHGTEPAVTAALGRLATGALLLGAELKEEQHTISLRVMGDGPAGTLIATSNGKGDVRGLVARPQTGAEQVRDGKLNVSGVVGSRGRLSVSRDIGLRQPYVGVVELLCGEIGEDIAQYLVSSVQTPSAVGIGVFVDAWGRVEAAGGWMIQLMPGVSDHDATSIDERVRELPHPTTMLRSGDAPEDVLGRIFGEEWELLDRMPVRFHCPCSIERVERALLLLGEDELRTLAEKDRETGFTEITCEFCGRQFTLETAAMSALAESAASHD